MIKYRNVKVPFQLENLDRKDDTPVHKTLREAFKNELSKNEILALATAYMEGQVSNSRLQLISNEHPYDITKMLHQLVQDEYLIVDGYGKGRQYYINDNFLRSIDSVNLTADETVIVEYIKKKGFINNKLSREELGFSKDKNTYIFNSLLRKQVVGKTGSGNQIKYVLRLENNKQNF